MIEPYVGMKICLDNIAESEKCSSMDSGCTPSESSSLSSLSIAMAYVPIQQWNKTYSPKEALMAGTVFPELNLPFKGKGGSCK